MFIKIVISLGIAIAVAVGYFFVMLYLGIEQISLLVSSALTWVVSLASAIFAGISCYLKHAAEICNTEQSLIDELKSPELQAALKEWHRIREVVFDGEVSMIDEALANAEMGKTREEKEKIAMGCIIQDLDVTDSRYTDDGELVALYSYVSRVAKLFKADLVTRNFLNSYFSEDIQYLLMYGVFYLKTQNGEKNGQKRYENDIVYLTKKLKVKNWDIREEIQ